MRRFLVWPFPSSFLGATVFGRKSKEHADVYINVLIGFKVKLIHWKIKQHHVKYFYTLQA